MTEAPVLAAGAVCWREAEPGQVEILLIHRPHHRDVSLPKGKVDPGEALTETAVREVQEETGLEVALGVPLGTVEYLLPNGRDKRVHYWAAEVEPEAVANSTFQANDEVEELRWADLDTARDELSYEHDVDVVDRFAELVAADSARTFAVIALRHGKAVPPQEWDGPDASRPLTARGVQQARAAARAIAAYRPQKLVSSPAQRCRRTIEPTERLMGLPVKETEALSQDEYRADGERVRKAVAKRLRGGVTAVLCSHSPVLPQIIAAVATGSQDHAIDFTGLSRIGALGTGEFAVLHVAKARPDAGLVAVEVHSPGV